MILQIAVELENPRKNNEFEIPAALLIFTSKLASKLGSSTPAVIGKGLEGRPCDFFSTVIFLGVGERVRTW